MKANPKDTGRMAASWTVGHNTPNRSVKRRAAGGTEVEVRLTAGRLRLRVTWYISNNVPYAQPVCLLGLSTSWGAAPKAQKDWFTSIANQTGNVFTTQFNKVKP